MQFPTAPTCHGADPVFRKLEPTWRAPEASREPYGESFRRCYYCGSIHPEDLLKALQEGATLEGTDRKYGWPHKFYVEGIPNLIVGRQVQMGFDSRWDGEKRIETPIMGAAPATVPAKWYNEHLLDEGYDDEARGTLIAALEQHAHILFFFENGKLKYQG